MVSEKQKREDLEKTGCIKGLQVYTCIRLSWHGLQLLGPCQNMCVGVWLGQTAELFLLSAHMEYL